MLYIVATPIGNLSDISLRALETLKSVDLILCEDTRVTRKLLTHYQISKPVLSYHQHSKISKIDHIIDLLKSGQNLALVSDAGTPTISDPGSVLISEVLKALPQLEIVAIPGACALITLASAAGWPVDRFLFLGFLPIKNKRTKFIEEIISSKYPVIFYESIYRLKKTLNNIQSLSEKNNIVLEVVIGRELTKKFETIYRGELKLIINQLSELDLKGECVVAIRKIVEI